ncbi:MAG: RluA family pseudouridine synthase [Bacteroidia bacterium]|nr:RluA family pseudouridine synthase [Bacteroidia bacterium]NNJ56769.1 RluA family pseudouridine synthase [Bacteroidia bacterium]
MKRFNFKDSIVFENDNYIAICKPAGISSLHERLGQAKSVFEEAKKYDESLQLCHRLDKETSGVLLLSKHSEAYAHAAKSFEKRKVKKVYHAVSDGTHGFRDLEINLPLITTRSGRSAVNSLKGKPSTTVFNSLENFNHFTLVQCEPVSGRQHQIRIHLATQNAAIAADTIYGGKQPYLSRLKRDFTISEDKEEKPMIQRFALHAYSLKLEDIDGSDMEVVAEYPKDMFVFLKLLRKYDKANF